MSTSIRRTSLIAFVATFVAFAWAKPDPNSEIAIKLGIAHEAFIVGERVRATVEIANMSALTVDVGSPGSPDRLVVEVFRASDRRRYEPSGGKPFTAPFEIAPGGKRKLETHLAVHYPLDEPSRYLARAVLVRGSMRYESSLKSFDVAPGLKCGGARQLFAEKPDLSREFTLLHSTRGNIDHLFLAAVDSGVSRQRWVTADLGPYMSVTRPKVSVLPNGEVVVLHRATQDAFVRSVFWSLPEAFEINEHELMTDPDVAGVNRMKELYGSAEDAEPVKKAWWKFW